MKLVYIANFRIPTEKAHGYQVAKMCEAFALQKRGYAQIGSQINADNIEVELIIPTRKNDIKQDLFEYYGIERNFTVTKISVPDFIALTPLFLRKLGFFLQSFFYLFKLFFHAKNLRGFNSSSNRRNSAISDNLRGSAMIYSRNPEIIFLFSRLGFKTIFESHRWSMIWLHKFFVKKTSKIVAVTAALKELYKGAGFNDMDILVAPDGVDLDVFDINISKEEARKTLNLPQDKILLGYTGSLQTMGMEKGHSEILEALRKISETRNDVYFVSVGSRPSADKISNDSERFSERVRASEPPERGLSASETESASSEILDASSLARLINVERVSRNKLALYQKAFDILLMPFPATTHYTYYMSPMKMFEYMASKRPIVASDLPSVREVLNESSAIFVEPGNPKSLADGIQKLLSDPGLGEKLAARAYEGVQSYTWEKRAELIIRAIRN
ncbi:glycosyltransferase [Candidatus Giovannonibacteria bacterium]|nr:glycosyltransferase [Candidatus Giovannonibacteria bacterium]